MISFQKIWTDISYCLRLEVDMVYIASLMNGPQRTACFAKRMHNSTFSLHISHFVITSNTMVEHNVEFTIFLIFLTCPNNLQKGSPLAIKLWMELSHKTRTDGRTDGQCSNLHFAPALKEPMRNNNYTYLKFLVQSIKTWEKNDSEIAC